MINNKTLSEQTYLELKKMIVNRKFEPGQKITEEEIADQLGISRTTVKKAFTTLVKDGLLEDRPRQGVFIRKYSLQEILEIYDLREVTAGLCARYAALNMTNKEFLELEGILECMKAAIAEKNHDEYVECDMKFHDKIVEYSRAMITPDIISNFHISLLSFNIGLIRDPEETVMEHGKIIGSLREGNTENAEKLMREHIRKSREILAKRMQVQE